MSFGLIFALSEAENAYLGELKMLRVFHGDDDLSTKKDNEDLRDRFDPVGIKEDCTSFTHHIHFGILQNAFERIDDLHSRMAPLLACDTVVLGRPSFVNGVQLPLFRKSELA